MRVGSWTWHVAVLTFAPLSLAQPTAHAQSPAEFYKGRNVELYIGYSVGGAYDLYARVLARHLGRHIPGSLLAHSGEHRRRAANQTFCGNASPEHRSPDSSVW